MLNKLAIAIAVVLALSLGSVAYADNPDEDDPFPSLAETNSIGALAKNLRNLKRYRLNYQL